MAEQQHNNRAAPPPNYTYNAGGAYMNVTAPPPPTTYHHDYPPYIQNAVPSYHHSQGAVNPVSMAQMQSAMASMTMRPASYVPTIGFNPNAIPFQPQGYNSSTGASINSYQQAAPQMPGYGNAYDQYPYLYEQQQPAYQQDYGNPFPAPYMDGIGDFSAELAYDAMYSTASASQQVALSPDLDERLIRSQSRKLLSEVQVGLEQLAAEPDEFETWSSAIRERLVDRGMNTDGLGVAAEITIEMAVLCPNVQYNFARLLAFLCRDIPKFRDSMLPSLQKIHENTRSMLTPEQLQNLLLFFAELYIQLETDTGSRFHHLVPPIFEQLEGLVQLMPVSDQSMKSVVQILKLCGRYLDEEAEDKQRMNKLLTTVNAIAIGCPTISETIKRQMKSVVELRDINWGAKSNEAYKAESLAAGARFQGSSANGSIIMGPDGMPLTAEEREFLEENFGRLDSCGTDTADDPSPEMMADYEEFLAEQQRHEAQAAAGASYSPAIRNNTNAAIVTAGGDAKTPEPEQPLAKDEKAQEDGEGTTEKKKDV